MSENLTLYFSRGSIASQAVLMLIKILKIEIQMEDVDLSGALHPVNKVPVLVHGELILTESRVILSYLVDSFELDDSLYPRELKRRAMIEQRLFYDAAVVYPCIMNIIRPAVLEKEAEITQKSKDALFAVFRVLEGLLDNSKWKYFSGNEISIADISFLANVTLSVELGLTLSQFPFVLKWYESMKLLEGFEENLINSKRVAKLVAENCGGSVFARKN